MKTPEDEAFEDIERRQGGFQAKRAAAADKVHEYVPLVEIEYTLSMADIKEALAQPAQEQNKITFRTSSNWVMRITADRRIEVNEGVEVTEAAKKVLEALQSMLKPAQEPCDMGAMCLGCEPRNPDGSCPDARSAQEPVAWMWKDMRGQDVISLFEPRLNSIPLYTAPPKREWIELTSEETPGFTSQELALVKYASRVLQEKNNG